MSRRTFLALSAIAGASLTAYGAYRGVRFPQLSFEPKALPRQFSWAGISATSEDVIQTPSAAPLTRFRAFSPEPRITLRGKAQQNVSFTLNNVAADARLHNSANATIEQSIEGITRQVSLVMPDSGEIELHWQLPLDGPYHFAAIGDTGGAGELAWCIQRAVDLGARFLLHLGDFNYQAGDYQRSIALFDSAPLPIYVSIGNHDFHDDGLLHDKFRQNIGPLNHSFMLGDTRFVNLDTAANTLPFGAGHRGSLLTSLRNDKRRVADTVVFTHRPLYDPSEDSDHDIGSDGERDWLIAELRAIDAATLISGHIHIYNRGQFDGIENIIVGQGLGHQDLIVNRDYSKMLIGAVNQAGKVTYSTAPLAMPMELHCHPRSDVVKESLVDSEHYEVIQQIERACAK